jgi:hypothetical protein
LMMLIGAFSHASVSFSTFGLGKPKRTISGSPDN